MSSRQAEEDCPVRKSDSDIEGPSTVTRTRAAGILAASATAAASSLLITVISARTLTVEQNKEFLVFWGLMFAIFGVIAGTQTESTRAAMSGAQAGAGARAAKGRASVLAVALVLGLAAASLTALSSPVWVDALTPTTGLVTGAIVALGVLAYAGEMSLLGIFAGLRRWSLYSLLMSAEAVLRLLLTSVVWFLVLSGALPKGDGLLPLEIAAAIPAMTWLFFLVWPSARGLFRSRGDVGMLKLVSFNVQAMISSASWAVLVTGFPTLLDLTSPGAAAAETAVVILAVTITRAPIMIPLQAFQGVLDRKSVV